MLLEETECLFCKHNSAKFEARTKDYIYKSTEKDFNFVKCCECGHIYLNPRPKIEDISVIYPKNYASFSGKFSKQNPVLTKIKDAVLLSRFSMVGANLPEGSKVLEIGCGDGQLLKAIKRKHMSFEVSGLDWKYQKETELDLKSHGVLLIEGTLEKVELSEDHYDFIILNQLIEHLWEPESAIVKLQKSLKKGGFISISTPNVDGFDRAYFKNGCWGGYYAPRHLQLFNQAKLRNLLEKTGYSIISQKNLVAPVIWAYSLQSVSIEKFNSPKLKNIFDVNNLLFLALFTLLDFLAIKLGFSTSNQMLIAKKKYAGN